MGNSSCKSEETTRQRKCTERSRRSPKIWDENNRSPYQLKTVVGQLREYADPLPERLTSLDRSRRLVVHHFHSVHRLRTLGIVDDKFVRGVIQDSQVDILLGAIEPLHPAWRSDYDHSMFDYFARLYPEVTRLSAKERESS